MIGTKETTHIPIMLHETARFLNLQRGGNFLDCTFGGGGHSRYFLENYPNITLFAIDRDPTVTVHAERLRAEFGNRFQFFNGPFSTIDRLSLPLLRGIFFDFGISTLQLDDEVRGFSFRYHTPLDMRMDPQNGLTAHEFLATADRGQLIEAIRDFGEEHHWRKIVDSILAQRGSEMIKYADTFAECIAKIVQKKFHEKIHPATRTFQGLRIAVNRELEEIRTVLPKAFEQLEHNGRLVALSFHSLEDRIVKQFFNEKAGKAIDCHEKWNDRSSIARILTKKPMAPTDAEITHNHRSRSAKLRALEKF
ncbi:MAG: 16S rRNA (cytosine(1402)-N(4))-methyltransferase RsmH [Puniceicoccales bacterium]|jgi:16S rRNA (cytosine1402-N4)-methyltransferase|nr:16S rRNA (cytosine(1402)-N(4))-methyltransferase RsmH [Puniceicoccales bacterium]